MSHACAGCSLLSTLRVLYVIHQICKVLCNKHCIARLLTREIAASWTRISRHQRRPEKYTSSWSEASREIYKQLDSTSFDGTIIDFTSWQQLQCVYFHAGRTPICSTHQHWTAQLVNNHWINDVNCTQLLTDTTAATHSTLLNYAHVNRLLCLAIRNASSTKCGPHALLIDPYSQHTLLGLRNAQRRNLKGSNGKT